MLKLFGAAMIIAGCGGMGAAIVCDHRKQVHELKSLKNAIQEMLWELKYRVSPLPELCHVGAMAARGTVRQVFTELMQRLEENRLDCIAGCVNGLAGKYPLSRRTRNCLRYLGDSLGRYDLEGQIQGLEEAKDLCRRELEELKEVGSEQLRTCQTLAVCAGVALVILFI